MRDSAITALMFSSSAARRWAGAFALVVLALFLHAPSPAWASFELVDTLGESSSPAQQEQQGIGRPGGVAVNESSGDVYIAQGSELLRFSANGSFEGKLGYDVIERGPDNSPNDNRSTLTVQATGGTFKLQFGERFEGVGQELATTPALPYNATAAEVEAAVDALPTMEGVGGSVSVSGGPGDETGSKPYEITFTGNWSGDYFGGEHAFNVLGQELTGPGHTIKEKVVANGGGLEDCVVAAGDVCKDGVSPNVPGALNEAATVAVDQSTGDLYVLTNNAHEAIQVFSSSGKYISSFGESGRETAAQIEPAPGQVLAVDSAGRAYVISNAYGGSIEPRVMVFEPDSPGDYEHYKYAGVSHDLFTGKYAAYGDGLAIDSHGDFFIGDETELYEFEAGDMSTPAFEYHLRPSNGFTVDPTSGEVFYYDEPAHKYRKIDLATGEELDVFPGAKGQENITGIAFNPGIKWEGDPTRPAGVLYSASTHSIESGRSPFAGIFSQAQVFPPRIASESVVNVGSTSTALRASIDPSGYVTRYRFQYGSEDCATQVCAEAPLGGGELGSGQEALAASVSLSGLQPDTTYHYRVLASNQFGTVEGMDQTFTTYPALAAGLPDGRAYELVSPAFKDGGEVFPARAEAGSAVCSECTPGENSVPGALQAAPDGNSVVYEGFPFAAAGGTVGYNEYLSSRTGSGWQTQDLSPQLESPEGGRYSAFSSDLSQGVLTQVGSIPLSDEAPAGYPNLYAQNTNEAGSLRPLMAFEPPDVSHGFRMSFGGASADFAHLVFVSNEALTPATSVAPEAQYAGASTGNVYEWTGGALRLVNVLPGNATSDPKAALGAGEALSTTGGGPDYSHAVSADGSRIFWSDEASGQVYVRENGETTLQIPDPGRFLTASADGSRILLADGHLYDLEGGSTTDLTAGHGGFQGVVGASEDLSRVYFVDTAVLTGGQTNDRSASAQIGADNLYEYDASGSGSTEFVATLAASDNQIGWQSGLTGDWTASPTDRTAQATSDGRFLAFVSTVSLTGYDNTETKGAPVAEVYEYDAEDDALVCASCGLPGLHPAGGSSLGLVRPFGGGTYPQPRDVLMDGRVFFNSRASLSPYDINGLVQDVYEYEPLGLGSCLRQPGCVSLISRGIGSRDSEFVDASASGSDVFFTTRDQLVPADQDDLEDLYDARVDGGFPELTAPACTGTGCQGIPGAPPIFATPSSLTFSGVGNFESTSTAAAVKPSPKGRAVRCAKGRRLTHGRCVKSKKAKRARTAHGAHKTTAGHRDRFKGGRP